MLEGRFTAQISSINWLFPLDVLLTMLIPLILRITIYVITIIHDDISSNFIFHSASRHQRCVRRDETRDGCSCPPPPHLRRSHCCCSCCCSSHLTRARPRDPPPLRCGAWSHIYHHFNNLWRQESHSHRQPPATTLDLNNWSPAAARSCLLAARLSHQHQKSSSGPLCPGSASGALAGCRHVSNVWQCSEMSYDNFLLQTINS